MVEWSDCFGSEVLPNRLLDICLGVTIVYIFIMAEAGNLLEKMTDSITFIIRVGGFVRIFWVSLFLYPLRILGSFKLQKSIQLVIIR